MIPFHLENVWGIIKARTAKEKYSNDDEYKMYLDHHWRELSKDKETLKRLMSSIPRRLERIIKNGWAQL